MEDKKLCDYGCGNEAKFQMKNRKWCCQTSHHKCSKVKQKNRDGHRVLIDGKYVATSLREYNKGGKCWNKGLTKDTDERLKKTSETIKQRFKDGKLTPSFLGKQHTEESKKKIAKFGGIRQGSGRGKHGWYKGYWCDSSWELAWVIYNLEHDIQFSRNKTGFEYIYNNKKYKFFPDFITNDNTYIEIKGYIDKKNIAKIQQFPNKLKVILKDDIKIYLDYVT